MREVDILAARRALSKLRSRFTLTDRFVELTTNRDACCSRDRAEECMLKVKKVDLKRAVDIECEALQAESSAAAHKKRRTEEAL